MENAAHLALREVDSEGAATRWVEEFLGPHLRALNETAAERDRNSTCIPRSFFDAAGATGLFGFLVPARHGGLGGDRGLFGRMLEQVGKIACEVEVASLLSLFADLPCAVAASAQKDTVDDVMPALLRGTCLAAFAYTERNDVAHFQTRVRDEGSRLVLEGEKSLVTGGRCADVFLVYAAGDAGLEVILVKATDPGVQVHPVRTLGFRAAGLSRITFDDVRLSSSRRLFPSDGLGQVQTFLNSRRLFVVCAFPGRMERMLAECATHLSSVMRDERPLTDFLNVQTRLGRMYAQTHAARSVLHAALDRWSQNAFNDVFDAQTVAAKYTVAELAMQTARDALSVTGWLGYSDELPFERDLRSFMGAIAGQTTQDKLELLLGANLVAHHQMNSLKEVFS